MNKKLMFGIVVGIFLIGIVSAGWFGDFFKKEEVKEEIKTSNIEYPKAPVFHELYFPTKEYGWVLEQGVFEEDGIGVYYYLQHDREIN